MPPRRTTRAALQAKQLEEGGGREEKALSDRETEVSGKNKRRGGRAGDSDKPREPDVKRSRVRTKKANPASAVGSVSSTKEGRKGGKRAGKKKEKMASSAGGRRKRRQRTNAATGSSEAAGEGMSVCEGVSAMVDKSSYFQEYVECITIIIVSMA